MYIALTSLENGDTIETDIRIEETMLIRGIRLGLYKHNAPDGTLTLAIYDGATQIASKAVTMAELDAAVGTYFHGMVLFDLGTGGASVRLASGTTYEELTLKITLSGHTDDADNFIGLINQPEAAQFVTKHGTITAEGSQSIEELTYSQPYQIEIFKIG